MIEVSGILHKGKDHHSNYRGINNRGSELSTRNARQEQVMIQLQPDGAGAAKSLNAPAVSKVQELHGLVMPTHQMKKRVCRECNGKMGSANHYR